MESAGNCTANPDRWGYLLLVPIPLVAGIINLTVGLAATLYRKKLLRQSYVYICVTSTLLSNILFICLHLWEEIAHYQFPDAAAVEKPNETVKVGSHHCLWHSEGGFSSLLMDQGRWVLIIVSGTMKMGSHHY